MKSSNELQLYDFERSFESNFSDNEDKHIVIRISKKNNDIHILPDIHSKCLSKPDGMIEISQLRYLVWDYDTIFGTRYNIFKSYDKDFFDCQERVLFEALLINFKRKGFKSFKWEKTKITCELGIKRKKIESIIKRFKSLGIIKSTIVKSHKKPIKGIYANSTYFTLDCETIHELLPKIFSRFNYEKIESDLKSYLAPLYKTQNSS